MVKGGAIDNSTGLKVKGMGRDTQLIAAEPGEIMMSKKAVDTYGASNLLKANLCQKLGQVEVIHLTSETSLVLRVVVWLVVIMTVSQKR